MLSGFRVMNASRSGIPSFTGVAAVNPHVNEGGRGGLRKAHYHLHHQRNERSCSPSSSLLIRSSPEPADDKKKENCRDLESSMKMSYLSDLRLEAEKEELKKEEEPKEEDGFMLSCGPGSANYLSHTWKSSYLVISSSRALPRSSSKNNIRYFSEMAGDSNVRPLVLCGPSGAGKSTLMKKLTEEFKDSFGFSVSHTTRNPREGELDGKHYHFVTFEKINEMIENGEFLENATFSGNKYGTSYKAVQDIGNEGKICILDIEMQGVKQIKNSNYLNPLYVFIQPPSLNILEKRLRDRKTETEESLQKRLDTAKIELEYGSIPGNFDITIINDEIDTAYGKLREFLLPHIERSKR